MTEVSRLYMSVSLSRDIRLNPVISWITGTSMVRAETAAV